MAGRQRMSAGPNDRPHQIMAVAAQIPSSGSTRFVPHSPVCPLLLEYSSTGGIEPVVDLNSRGGQAMVYR